MNVSISPKNCEIFEDSEKLIVKYTEKIERFLPKVSQDILRLEITMKYEKLYKGTLHLHLPNATLEARFENKLQDTAIREGFDILFEEIAKYKGIHFPSHSDYPDRESVKTKLS